MVTPTDAERIFTEGFMRFVDHAVENIQFRIDYPQSLDQLKSAAEEISTEVTDVSTVNYAYNSSQFFFELFNSLEGIDGSETITLTASFNGPEGTTETVTVEKTIAELMAVESDQIYAAAAVTTLADLVAQKIKCEPVMASSLYQMDIASTVFQTYKKAISDYCEYRTTEPAPNPGSASSSMAVSSSSHASSSASPMIR